MKSLLAILILALAGCSTNPPASSPASPKALPKLDIASQPLAKFTHDDLTSAAAYATANGYTARAAVWTAIDAQLTACENAISSFGPKTKPAATGVFTLIEVGAEAVGTGIPAAIKINCEAIVIPGGLLRVP